MKNVPLPGIPISAVREPSPALAFTSAGSRLQPSASPTDLPTLSGIRILAVDDEDDTREMVKGVLEKFGADVLSAGSAREAFDVLHDWRPDVIVCDIGMPGEDGYSLIWKVRHLESHQDRNTPAIALTGFARPEDRKRALAAGYQMFIPKPVETNQLISTIAKLIGPANGQR